VEANLGSDACLPASKLRRTGNTAAACQAIESTYPVCHDDLLAFAFRLCSDSKNFGEKIHVALSFIWQNLSNHGLTSLKRFASTFTEKLCN
jgi:hypothetical protein